MAFLLRNLNSPNNHQVDIFEQNQEHLARTVESLSASLEHSDFDVSEAAYGKLRAKLIDLTV